MEEYNNTPEAKNNKYSLPQQANNIIKDLEYKLYRKLLKENGEMEVGDFRNKPEIKEISTTIDLLKKFYKNNG